MSIKLLKEHIRLYLEEILFEDSTMGTTGTSAGTTGTQGTSGNPAEKKDEKQNTKKVNKFTNKLIQKFGDEAPVRNMFKNNAKSGPPNNTIAAAADAAASTAIDAAEKAGKNLDASAIKRALKRLGDQKSDFIKSEKSFKKDMQEKGVDSSKVDPKSISDEAMKAAGIQPKK